MTLRHLDLTTALRPSLLAGEVLLFVQDGVGLYRDKYKIEHHQSGHAYLTSHRICYVDNDDPRQRSVGIDLRDVDRPELYAGFLKSSPKITIYPKPAKRQSLAVRTSAHRSSPSTSSLSSSPGRSGLVSANASPAPPPQETNATWVCPICSFSNPVPSNFDPSTANANTPLPPCLACGIKPPLVHVTKAALAALANRGPHQGNSIPAPVARSALASVGRGSSLGDGRAMAIPSASFIECPRCTFRNHPSIRSCEICGASLSTVRDSRLDAVTGTPPSRTDSPAPTTSLTSPLPTDAPIEVLKLSFRAGGEKTFYDRLKDALIQRKWLLESGIPPPPRPSYSPDKTDSATSAADSAQRRIGIAGLERREHDIRTSNAAVLGTAFSDLEALMTSAKEVIALAERFAKSNASSSTSSSATSTAAAAADATSALTALGLTATRDTLSGERTYLTQLARDLAEYLTDDATDVLRREGGVMTLVDLWAVFNRRRNGIELVSPRDFGSAAELWSELRLPVRLRRFRSGTLVVQGVERSDDRTVAQILDWLRREPPPPPLLLREEVQGGEAVAVGAFGRGATAQEAAERFGWSVGVAAEELDVAEERGAVVRDQDASGVRFWVNHFAGIAAGE